MDHVTTCYSEGEPLSTDRIEIATEWIHAKFIAGYGVAAFTVPALPGSFSIYLINEDPGERLAFVRNAYTKADARRIVDEADLQELARAFEARCEAIREVTAVSAINSTPRSYCIGLPVVITVHDDDTVTYEIDYSEATDLWDGAPTHSDGLTPIYDDELIEADIDRVSADIARRNQAARTRLADEAADAVSLGRVTKDDDRG